MNSRGGDVGPIGRTARAAALSRSSPSWAARDELVLTCSDGHPPYAGTGGVRPQRRSAKKKHASTFGPRGVPPRHRESALRDDVFRLGRMAKKSSSTRSRAVQPALPTTPPRGFMRLQEPSTVSHPVSRSTASLAHAPHLVSALARALTGILWHLTVHGTLSYDTLTRDFQLCFRHLTLRL